jgi:hypothetical protein
MIRENGTTALRIAANALYASLLKMRRNVERFNFLCIGYGLPIAEDDGPFSVSS